MADLGYASVKFTECKVLKYIYKGCFRIKRSGNKWRVYAIGETNDEFLESFNRRIDAEIFCDKAFWMEENYG